jgi:hypothetical protein
MSVDSMEIYAIEIYRVYQGPFLAMLLAFQGSSTCHVPGQRCLAGCSKSNRLKRIWSKIIKSVFFLLCQNFVDQNRSEFRSYSVHRHRMGFEDDILTFWQPWHLITESPAALGLLCGQEGESPILGGWDLPTCIFRPPRCTKSTRCSCICHHLSYLSPFHLFPLS